MNPVIIDLSGSQWCSDIRQVFRNSPTAFSEFLQSPVETLVELGFDDEVTLSDGAKARVSSLLSSLSALELNQVAEAVRPLTYRAGDGGDGGDGGSCGVGDGCGTPPSDGDPTAALASAVAIASNVAVVGEVAVAIASVAVVIHTSGVGKEGAAEFSPALGVVFGPDFSGSSVYRYLDAEGLSDARKRALIKERLISARVGSGRMETNVLGKQVWLDLAQSGPSIEIMRGDVL